VGIWTALITWGIAIRPQTQRACGYVCAAFGIILACTGLAAVWGFRTLNLDRAKPGIAGVGQPGSTDTMTPMVDAFDLETNGQR
jgi:hypothetical protein